MPDEQTPAAPPLVEIPNDELARDLGLILQLTKGRVARDSAAREAFAIIGARVADYFREHGYVVMRPAPRKAHSSSDFGMRLPGRSQLQD